ncbi:MAG: SCO family protein [Rhodospirillales bacterium]|nr:SCO family protein [Rhodospirillales bacterium]
MTARWRVWGLPVAAFLLVLIAGAGGWLYLSHDAAQPVGGIGGPFALTDGAGHAVTDRDLRGRYLLVYFGYTFCPDVCPTTLTAVAGALDRLGKRAERLQPLFITVDPLRDTPRVVRDYAAAFSPRILGLTGTPEQIARVARAYRVYYARHRTGEGPDDYTMDHSSILYLMGPQGRFIAPIAADEPAGQMAADIARHMGAG